MKTQTQQQIYTALADRFRMDETSLSADELADLLYLARSHDNPLLTRRVRDALLDPRPAGPVIEASELKFVVELIDLAREDPNYSGYARLAGRRAGLSEIGSLMLADHIHERLTKALAGSTK